MRHIEEELGSVQADALGARVVHASDLLGDLEVRVEPDPEPVGRACRQRSQFIERAQRRLARFPRR